MLKMSVWWYNPYSLRTLLDDTLLLLPVPYHHIKIAVYTTGNASKRISWHELVKFTDSIRQSLLILSVLFQKLDQWRITGNLSKCYHAKKAIRKHSSQNIVKSTDGSASQMTSYEWLNLGHSSVSGQTNIFLFSFSLIKTNAFFCCITFGKWFTIILHIGNIFNVIVNEGLRVNDLMKNLWILRSFDEVVSGLLFVLVWFYVLFPSVLYYELFPSVLHFVLLLLDQ